MKLGIFGARADSRGLAYQTQAYAKWLTPDRIYGLDLTADDMSPYPCEWTPYWDCDELTICQFSKTTEESVRRWLRGLDVVFGAETFYFDEFPDWARAEGVKTVLHINPEFTGWWGLHKDAPKPDVLLNPTIWRQDLLPGVIHLPFPVDRELFPFRLRTQAKRFVHPAGHVAAADRAGTRIVMAQGIRLKTHDIVIRSQSPLPFQSPGTIQVEEGNISDPRSLYADADVIIQPRRYGGNNLIANEALSSGCPMITLDREPENTWGGVLTIPTRLRGSLRTKAGPIPVYDAQPHALLRAIKHLSDRPEEVEALSLAADRYAQSISWDVLLPRYMDLLRC